jgi:hypothetical protein
VYLYPNRDGNEESRRSPSGTREAVTQGYCGPQPELLETISASTNFPADKIRKSIEALTKARYWDSLEEEAGEAVGDDGFGDEYEDLRGGHDDTHLKCSREKRFVPTVGS